VAWVPRLADNHTLLLGVAFGRGCFVAVGGGGTILQSGPAFSLATGPLPGPSGFSLTLSGEHGCCYRIQTTTNISNPNWEDLITMTNTAPAMQFLDAGTTNLPRRFYRAVAP
jgi:hypothetical protein